MFVSLYLMSTKMSPPQVETYSYAYVNLAANRKLRGRVVERAQEKAQYITKERKNGKDTSDIISPKQ